MERKGDWISTFTGRQYWPLDPRPGEVNIIDIAHALSNQCRWGGHTKHFYSVAEHSIAVSYAVPEPFAFEGLLHDATEAYLVDLPRPIKASMPIYRDTEALNWKAIAERFRLPQEISTYVHEADNRVLLAEADHLMTGAIARMPRDTEPAPMIVVGWEPREAKRMFLERFEELMARRAL
jgi:hypothetical protein